MTQNADLRTLLIAETAEYLGYDKAQRMPSSLVDHLLRVVQDNGYHVSCNGSSETS